MTINTDPKTEAEFREAVRELRKVYHANLAVTRRVILEHTTDEPPQP